LRNVIPGIPDKNAKQGNSDRMAELMWVAGPVVQGLPFSVRRNAE